MTYPMQSSATPLPCILLCAQQITSLDLAGGLSLQISALKLYKQKGKAYLKSMFSRNSVLFSVNHLKPFAPCQYNVNVSL